MKKKLQSRPGVLRLGDWWDCECGKRNRVTAFVARYWHMRMLHVCKKCGRKHYIQDGILERPEQK